MTLGQERLSRITQRALQAITEEDNGMRTKIY